MREPHSPFITIKRIVTFAVNKNAVICLKYHTLAFASPAGACKNALGALLRQRRYEGISWIILLLYGLLILNAAALLVLIFIEKAEPSVIAAWTLLFAALPPVGLLLYLLFGSAFQLRLLAQRYSLREIESEYSTALREHIKDIKTREIVFNDPAIEAYRDMVIMNARHCGAIYTQDNEVELFTSGPDKFAKMFEDIMGATGSIDIIYFIFKSGDKVGQRLIKLLADKAEQGVRVRLCYDRLGHPSNRLSDFASIIEAGGQVRQYMPSAFRTFIFMNYRMHRKIVIVDDRVAYVGGINVGDDYMGEDKRKTPWRDTAVRITGTAVWLLKMRFLSDWSFVDGQHKKTNRQRHRKMELEHTARADEQAGAGDTKSDESIWRSGVGVQIVSSGPDSEYRYMRDCYMKLATSASKYLYIQSPYYVPGESLHNAIVQAASSGVDVRVMVPRVPDFPLLHAASMSWARDLLKVGVKVYIYEGFLHSKMWIIDDTVASVGTTNVNLRSFMLNYEVNAVFYDTAFATRCREAFDLDTLACSPLKEQTYAGAARAFQTLCRLGGPFM